MAMRWPEGGGGRGGELPGESSERCSLNSISSCGFVTIGNKRYAFGGKTTLQMEDADVLMAKEMSKLSPEERGKVFEEIHGVADVIEEEPDFIAECLRKMEEEVLKIRKRPAYEKAVFVSPKSVRDSSFRLMFLRSVRFDPRKAAKKMVAYFEQKLELFGFDKLVKPITIHDLNQDDLKALYSGTCQFLPVKDRAGRTIVCNFHKYHDFKASVNQFRMVWYLVMVALEDEETQRNGVVNVIYNCGVKSLSEKDRDLFMQSPSPADYLPLRFASMHFCYDNASLRPLMAVIQMMIGTDNRLRFRSHYGTDLECQYALLTYGISTSAFPMNSAGDIELETFQSFLTARKRLERSTTPIEEARALDYIELPLSIDVVLGRGMPYQQFPGNLRLAMIIDQHRAEYQKSDRLNKTAISKRIVDLVKGSQGRFLKKSDEELGGWVEVSDEIAREKISHGFRTKTRRNSADAMTQVSGRY